MIKCPSCGFENSDNCTFCAICGSPVTENDFYVHNTTKTADISVEELNQKLVSKERKENEKTKSFTKLDKAMLNKTANSNNKTQEAVKKYSQNNKITDDSSGNSTAQSSKKNDCNLVETTQQEKSDTLYKQYNTTNATKKSGKNNNNKYTTNIKTAEESFCKNKKHNKTITNQYDNSSSEKSDIKSADNSSVKTSDTKQIENIPLNNTEEKGVKYVNNNKIYKFFYKLFFDTTDETETMDEGDIDENLNFAVLSYIPFIFFVPMIVKPRSSYLRYHGTQGLTMFLTFMLLEILNIFLCTISNAILSEPINIIATIIVTLVINMCVLLLIAIGIANAVKGFARELPVIGKYKLLEP